MNTQALLQAFDKLFFRKAVYPFFASLAALGLSLFQIFPENPAPFWFFVFKTVFIASCIGTVVFAVFSIYFLYVRKLVKKSLLLYRHGEFVNALHSLRKYPKKFYFDMLIQYTDLLKQLIKEHKPEEIILVEKETTGNQLPDNQQELDNEIQVFRHRLSKLYSLQKDIQQRITYTKNNLEKVNSRDIKQRYMRLLDQYNEMLNLTELKIKTYIDIQSRVYALKSKILILDKLHKEKLILERYTRKLLEEGYGIQYCEDYHIDFRKTQDYHVEAVKEFILSDIDIDNRGEFQRLTHQLYEKLARVKFKE